MNGRASRLVDKIINNVRSHDLCGMDDEVTVVIELAQLEIILYENIIVLFEEILKEKGITTI